MPTMLIIQLPEGPTFLTGSELLEIQNGSGVGASQQTTVAKIVSLALESAVQSIGAGTGGVVINDANPNAPIISIPVPVAGANITINNSNPEAPVISATVPSDGGISAAYGSPGGSVLTTGNSIQGIVTSNYTLTGWKIQCSPSGSITVDVRVGSLGSTLSSIVGTGNGPSVAASTYNSASTLTGWTTTTVAQGSVIEFVVTAVSNVEWFNVALLGTRG